VSTPACQVLVQTTSCNVVEVQTPGPQGPAGGNFTAPTTVANLGTPIAGTRSQVIDATVTTFASIVVGGGGNAVPVYADGNYWRIG
jgi:hypothetical protein